MAPISLDPEAILNDIDFVNLPQYQNDSADSCAISAIETKMITNGILLNIEAPAKFPIPSIVWLLSEKTQIPFYIRNFVRRNHGPFMKAECLSENEWTLDALKKHMKRVKVMHGRNFRDTVDARLWSRIAV